MPFIPAPRGSSAVASVMTAGLMFVIAALMVIVAGCASQQTPPRQGQHTQRGPHVAAAGVVQGGATSQRRRLGSPFILDAVRIQPPTSGGGCPAGSVALSGGPGKCYRSAGTPLTITHAAVSSVFDYRLPHRPGHKAGPLVYGFVITLPAADHAGLVAVLTAVVNSHGHLDFSIAGQTWLIPTLRSDLTGKLEIAFPSKNLVLRLQSQLNP